MYFCYASELAVAQLIHLHAVHGSFAVFTNLSSDQQYTLLMGVATGNDRSAFVYNNPLTGMELS